MSIFKKLGKVFKGIFKGLEKDIKEEVKETAEELKDVVKDTLSETKENIVDSIKEASDKTIDVALDTVEEEVVKVVEDKIEDVKEVVNKVDTAVQETKEVIETVEAKIKKYEEASKDLAKFYLYDNYVKMSLNKLDEGIPGKEGLKRYWDAQFNNQVKKVIKEVKNDAVLKELNDIVVSYDTKKQLRQDFLDLFEKEYLQSACKEG